MKDAGEKLSNILQLGRDAVFKTNCIIMRDEEGTDRNSGRSCRGEVGLVRAKEAAAINPTAQVHSCYGE